MFKNLSEQDFNIALESLLAYFDKMIRKNCAEIYGSNKVSYKAYHEHVRQLVTNCMMRFENGNIVQYVSRSINLDSISLKNKHNGIVNPALL